MASTVLSADNLAPFLFFLSPTKAKDLHCNTALEGFSKVNQKITLPDLTVVCFPDHQMVLLLLQRAAY